MKKFILFYMFFSLLTSQKINAQYLTGIATLWDDSFVEWEVFTEVEDEKGELKLRWNNDWTEWEYEIGEQSGNIKLKWKDRFDEWQLMADGEIITMRTVYRGDFSEWRIRNGNQSYTFKSKWKNQFEDWSVRDNKSGKFEVFTYRKGDPRDWTIIDEMEETVSFPTRMAMLFIAIFQSTPKE